MWISEAVDQGQIQPSRVAHHSGGPDAAAEWLRTHYHDIPQKLRPAEDDIGEFAAFFSTYLTSSFDVMEQPGTKGEGPAPTGCRCELCMRIVRAPHLRAKKLYAGDKKRAELLMCESVAELANEMKIRLGEGLVERIVADKNTRRDAAYVAYGHWLIRRLAGESDGPAILALWRLIAWDPRGGVRRGFTLREVDFEDAEQRILEAIQLAK